MSIPILKPHTLPALLNAGQVIMGGEGKFGNERSVKTDNSCAQNVSV